MTRRDALKREARAVAAWRGHNLGRFENATDYRAIAECDCGAYVQVNAKPMPNQIDIGGDAVALNHPIEREVNR